MENTADEKTVSAKKTLVLVLIVSLLFGAGVYVYENKKAAKDKENSDAKITALQDEISNLKNTPTENTTSASESDSLKNTDSSTAGKTAINNDKSSEWKTYSNKEYGYEIKYPDTISITSSDKDNDRIYISNVKAGDVATIRVISRSNIPKCADNTLTGEVKCFYVILDQNPDRISQKKFGDNTFIYADVAGVDHPNVKTRDIMAFMEKGDYIYQIETINPDSTQETIFKDMLASFKFFN